VQFREQLPGLPLSVVNPAGRVCSLLCVCFITLLIDHARVRDAFFFQVEGFAWVSAGYTVLHGLTMPFGKKALTPQAHTQGVGDEAHIAGALELLGRSRLMSLPEDDSPATREQRQAGFVEAEELFKRLQWLQPRNSQVFRSRFALRLPAFVRAHPRTRQHARAHGEPGS
jgi:hypothetical protein